jgi:hypothetical protein
VADCPHYQEAEMPDETDSDYRRVWVLVTGVLLVTMPALTLLVAYAVLTATRSVVLEQLTVVEAVELYLVELAAFAVFSYLLYRLTSHAIDRQSDTEASREPLRREPDHPRDERPEAK